MAMGNNDSSSRNLYLVCKTSKNPMDHCRVWHSVVNQYSALNLTKPTDRLAALSGIADLINEMRDGDYLAGLWSNTLVFDLLWTRNRTTKSTNSAASEVTQQGDYQWPYTAPSWSWASVDGPISYEWRHPMDKVYCEVVDAICIPAGESMTGQVLFGYVKLQCQIVEGRINGRPATIEIQDQLHEAVFDCYDRSMVGQPVHVARIAEEGRFDHSLVLHMDLKTSGGTDIRFTRLGRLRHVRDARGLAPGVIDWPDKMNEITIV